jgi:hypothetical protein
MFRNLRKNSNYGMELPRVTHTHTHNTTQHTHTQLAYLYVSPTIFHFSISKASMPTYRKRNVSAINDNVAKACLFSHKTV